MSDLFGNHIVVFSHEMAQMCNTHMSNNCGVMTKAVSAILTNLFLESRLQKDIQRV